MCILKDFFGKGLDTIKNAITKFFDAIESCFKDFYEDFCIDCIS